MEDKGFVLPAVAVGVGDDGVADGMLCAEHPQYGQRANPGGICALCLQEKLGRLVSSYPCKASSHSLFYPSVLAAPPYSDSPSSPPSSLRPAVAEATVSGYGRGAGGGRANSSLTSHDTGRHRSFSGNRSGGGGGGGGRSRIIPFLYSAHSRKKKPSGSSGGSSSTTTSGSASRKVMSSTASTSSLSAMSNTTSSSSGSGGGGGNPVFKRSKSVATRPTGGFSDACRAGGAITEDSEKFDSPRKKSFWSFLYPSYHQHTLHHSSSSPRGTTTNANDGSGATKRRAGSGGGGRDANGATAATATATPYIRDIKLLPQPTQLPAISTGAPASSCHKPQEEAKTPRDYPPAAGCSTVPPAAEGAAARGEAADDSPGSGSQASSSFGRKVARSRSVGCGSRSFSGDFLERISTGFGDCTLRRVESQREAKPSRGSKIVIHHRGSGEERELPPPRVRCGGLFGGFHSSSSSSYWLSDDLGSGNSGASGRVSTATAGEGADSGTPHARRSWVWAFASPMRAFRASSVSNKHAAIMSINAVTTGTTGGPATLNPTVAAVARSSATTSTNGGAALLAVKG